MIDYAVTAYPGVTFKLGDMRDVKLHRTFDVVMALGNGLNYLLTNEDIERAIETSEFIVILERCLSSNPTTPPA
jgi:hypothetical protein